MIPLFNTTFPTTWFNTPKHTTFFPDSWFRSHHLTTHLLSDINAHNNSTISTPEPEHNLNFTPIISDREQINFYQTYLYSEITTF